MGAGWKAVVCVVAVGSTACGERGEELIVRGADEVAVMSPDEVRELRASVSTTLAPLTSDVGAQPQSTAAAADSGTETTVATADTVPQNVDDRPPEQRLFDAYKEFSSCLADEGYEFHGNPQDPNDPSMQDRGYVDALSTCAARSDIVNVLGDVQAARAALSPDEVKDRNERFKELEACLVQKGWTIETSTDEIGLIQPTTFVSATGKLDERDIEQCSGALRDESENG